MTNSDGDGDYTVTVLDDRGRILSKQNVVAAGFKNLHDISIPAHSDYRCFVDVSTWYDLATPGVYRVSISRQLPSTNGTQQIKVSSATNVIRVLNVAQTSTNGAVLNLGESAR